MLPKTFGPGRIGPVFCSQIRNNAYLFPAIVLLMRTNNDHFQPMPGTSEGEGFMRDLNSAFEQGFRRSPQILLGRRGAMEGGWGGFKILAEIRAFFVGHGVQIDFGAIIGLTRGIKPAVPTTMGRLGAVRTASLPMIVFRCQFLSALPATP